MFEDTADGGNDVAWLHLPPHAGAGMEGRGASPEQDSEAEHEEREDQTHPRNGEMQVANVAREGERVAARDEARPDLHPEPADEPERAQREDEQESMPEDR